MALQSHPPATPSPSATLILARSPHEAGIEVYLLRRSTASKFMPGTYVFPGGNLEAEDMDAAFWRDHVDLPANQLAQALDGEVDQMLPFADLDTLMAETRSRSWPAPIMPRLWPLEKSALIIEPWDPDYTRETVSVDLDRLEKDVLPVGTPFSRLWCHRGICRPVRHPDVREA